MNITNDNAVRYYKKDCLRFTLGILFLCAIPTLILYCYFDALHKISLVSDMEVTPHNIFYVMNVSDGWYALIMIFCFTVALLLLLPSISRLKKWKAVTPGDAVVYDAEISAGISWLPTLGIYAADSHMYGFANGFTVCPYSDIAMLYKRINRYNYIKTSEEIIVLNKSGKTVIIADIPINPFQRIKESDINTELEFLGKTAAACNSDIFLGYDKEAYSALYKKYRKRTK